MVKRSSHVVGHTDLREYLGNHSDFSFEIRVLNSLVKCGFACEHGGTYDDPVTQKPRQFDIRATQCFGNRFVRLAVECKNIRDASPLLVSCVPRAPEDAFHEIVASCRPWQVSARGAHDAVFVRTPAAGSECSTVRRVQHLRPRRRCWQGVRASWAERERRVGSEQCRRVREVGAGAELGSRSHVSILR